MKKTPILLLLVIIPLGVLSADPVVRLELKPPEALPGLPVKWEIIVESLDGQATTIPNEVAVVVTDSNGQRFLAKTAEEVERFPAVEGDQIEIPQRRAVDLSYWYSAPWLVDCRLHQPGEYTVQLIVGGDPDEVLAGHTEGAILSNEISFRVMTPQGDDAKVYEAWKDASNCLGINTSVEAMTWEKYPDSTYAMYSLPPAKDPTDLNEEIGLFRESLRRWPESPLADSMRLGLAEYLVRRTDRAIRHDDLTLALDSARESQEILNDLSRMADDPVIRKKAAEVLDTHAYTEKEVLSEFNPDAHTRLSAGVECVEPTAGGMRVWFGYANPGREPVTIPVGPRNQMTPAPHDRGQPTTFNTGIMHLAFNTEVGGPVLTWHIDGTSVHATLEKSLRCPDDMAAEVAKLPRND